MRSYECAVIFAPTLAEDEVDAGARKYAAVVADHGGEMTRLETWGRRRLAYEIQHHGEGYYYFYKFRGDGRVVDELGRQLRIDESVLRHMIIRDELATGDEPAVDPSKLEIERTSEPQEA